MELSTLHAGDLLHLERCLELAAKGRFGAAPNPMVGAVVCDAQGRRLGEGFHRRAGGPHAEVAALAAVRAGGGDPAGGVVYVSLEPCCFQGRTPPCTDALLAAGVSRVVAIHRDPHPKVAGGGFRRLQEAGVEVAWLNASRPVSHDLVARAVELNWRFLVQQVMRRPAVSLKWAMSLDGRIATATGESQWISSPEGRDWALELREEHDAILVGSGTALADDPRLTRRLGHAKGPILRVVLDRRLRLSPSAKMFAQEGPVVVYSRRLVGSIPGSAPDQGSTDGARRATLLRRAGAEIVELDDPSPVAVLRDLHQRGVQSLLVEGGAEILGAFAAAGTFDRVTVCCAPRLIGGAGSPGPVGGAGFESLDSAPLLTPFSFQTRGPDVVLTSFRDACLRDLYASVAG